MAIDAVRVTNNGVNEYLDFIKKNNRAPSTIASYAVGLRDFLKWLNNRKVTNDTLSEYKKYLMSLNYASNTVNLRITSVNSLFRYLGLRDFTETLNKVPPIDYSNILSRDEYVKFLKYLYEQKNKTYYLLAKAFGSYGINVTDIYKITVEACNKKYFISFNGKRKDIKKEFAKELLSFAKSKDIESGVIFKTVYGNAMDRSNITNTLRRRATCAGLVPERCTPNMLHRLYVNTNEKIKESLEVVYENMYEDLIKSEQVIIES